MSCEDIASLQCLLCRDTFPQHCCVLDLVSARKGSLCQLRKNRAAAKNLFCYGFSLALAAVPCPDAHSVLVLPQMAARSVSRFVFPLPVLGSSMAKSGEAWV